QAGHACVNAVLMALARENRLTDVRSDGADALLDPADKPETPLSAWFRKGEAKVCVYVDSEQELLDLDKKARERGILSALICDAGMTEFHGQPTYTCLALEPLPIDKADELTGDLPLY
ncbi:MAG: peptidyl-tRNA hydrolase, partial [Candidatus Spyradocola sp.]